MIYLVEGNIGTGKSTFLQNLQKQNPYLQVVFESIQYWQHQENGASILENFYTNPTRYAYTMETLALKMRVQQHITHQNSTYPVFIERSLYSGYHCFALNSFKQGFLSPVEWNIYKTWFEFATNNQCQQPAGIIYLQADPEISYARTCARNRNEESTIALNYLEQIHQAHEDFLIHKTTMHQSLQQVPVITISCNDDFISTPSWDKVHTLVNEFVHTTHTPSISMQI